MEILVGLAAVVGAVVAVVLGRRANRDEVFDGITPGLLPAPGQEVARRRADAVPPLAVRFEPPDAQQPAVAGVIADGRFDPVELSATMIDLAVRGWLVLRPVGGIPAADGRSTPPSDWELFLTQPQPAEPLSPTEQAVLDAVFADGPATTLQQVRGERRLAAVMPTLQDEVERRRWFRPTGWPSMVRPLGWFAILGGAFMFWNVDTVSGAGLLLGGAILLLGLRGLARPLTAEGSAARTQAQGFRQYLATAEAQQLQFEAGIDRFGRYLPWAMVFGVVDHWREVFADALRADPDALEGLPAFGWLAVDNMLTTVLLLDMLDGGLFDGLAADFGSLDGAAVGLDGAGDAGGDGGFGDGGPGEGGDGGWGGFGDGGWGDGGGFDFGGGD